MGGFCSRVIRQQTSGSDVNICQKHQIQIVGMCQNLKCKKKDKRVCPDCKTERLDCKDSNFIDKDFTLEANLNQLKLLYSYTFTVAFPQQSENLIANFKEQFQDSINHMIQPLIEDYEDEFIRKYPKPIQQYLLEGAQQVIDIAEKSNFMSTSVQGFKLISEASNQVLENFQKINENEYSKKILSSQIFKVIPEKTKDVETQTMEMQSIIGKKHQNQEDKETLINLQTIEYELPLYESQRVNIDQKFGTCSIDNLETKAYCKKCQNLLCQKCIQQHKCQDKLRITLSNFNTNYEKLILCCRNFVQQLKNFLEIKNKLLKYSENVIKLIYQSIYASLPKNYKAFEGIQLNQLTYEAVQEIYDLHYQKSFNLIQIEKPAQQDVIITLVNDKNDQLSQKIQLALNELIQYSLIFQSYLKAISQESLKGFFFNNVIKEVIESKNTQSEIISQIIIPKKKIVKTQQLETIIERCKIVDNSKNPQSQSPKEGTKRTDYVQKKLDERSQRNHSTSPQKQEKPIEPELEIVSIVKIPSLINIPLNANINKQPQKTLMHKEEQFVTSLIEYENTIYCSYNDGQIIEFAAPNYNPDLWGTIDCGAIGALYCFKQVDQEYLVVYVNKSNKHFIYIHNLKARYCFTRIEAHKKQIMSIKRFNSTCYATLSNDCTIKIWSQITHEMTYHYVEHTNAVRDLVVLNESEFISLSLNEMLHFDHKKRETLQKVEGSFTCLQIIPNFVVVALREGKIEFRPLNNLGQAQKQFEIFEDGIISFMQILGTSIIISGLNEKIKQIDINTKKVKDILEKNTNQRGEVLLVIQGKIVFGDDSELKYIEY